MTMSETARPDAVDRQRGDAKIHIAGLGKTYRGHGKDRQVLADLELKVRDGEFLSIVGHSGAGKTTLLRCIAGLEPPSCGEVRFDGELVTEPPAGLALIFQDYGRSLFPWLRVLGNVTLPLRSAGTLSAQERRAAALDALKAVGLADAATQYPWQLSGGMQQRVAIARAIACRPEVLLMDEPFASVDAQTRADLEDLVLNIRRQYGVTVVLVTHDVDESVYMSDRVAVLGGTPTGVAELIDVDLPPERDQLTTKSLPGFIDLRTRVLRAVRELPSERKSGA